MTEGHEMLIMGISRASRPLALYEEYSLLHVTSNFSASSGNSNPQGIVSISC